jgi:hypothetical protein
MLLPALCACNDTHSSNETPAETTGETEYIQPTVDRETPLCDGKTLKLLAITSSFGLNTTEFLYDIAVAQGCTNVVVGRLYGSGCTLEKHVNNAANNTPFYQYTKNTDGKWQELYKYDENGQSGATMLHGLQDEDWDIIFIQQSAAQSGIADSYGDYVDQLMGYVHKNKTNPDARFVWNMTWAYQGDSEQSVFVKTFKSDQSYMYETIVDVLQEKIVPRTDFHSIVPSGTAIQNARTSYFGDTLCRDTYHLNNLGRVIAGYTLYSVLTGKALTEINLGPVRSKEEPSLLYLMDNDKQVIIEAVNAAIANPYEVTQSSLKNK